MEPSQQAPQTVSPWRPSLLGAPTAQAGRVQVERPAVRWLAATDRPLDPAEAATPAEARRWGRLRTGVFTAVAVAAVAALAWGWDRSGSQGRPAVTATPSTRQAPASVLEGKAVQPGAVPQGPARIETLPAWANGLHRTAGAPAVPAAPPAAQLPVRPAGASPEALTAPSPATAATPVVAAAARSAAGTLPAVAALRTGTPPREAAVPAPPGDTALDADAELLEAVMAWHERHPPAAWTAPAPQR